MSNCMRSGKLLFFLFSYPLMFSPISERYYWQCTGNGRGINLIFLISLFYRWQRHYKYYKRSRVIGHSDSACLCTPYHHDSRARSYTRPTPDHGPSNCNLQCMSTYSCDRACHHSNVHVAFFLFLLLLFLPLSNRFLITFLTEYHLELDSRPLVRASLR